MTAARDDRSLAGGPTGRPMAPGPRSGPSGHREPDGYETSGEPPRRTPERPGHSGHDADDSVFDIADDRRDDGNVMTYPPAAGGYRAPARDPYGDPVREPYGAPARDPYGDPVREPSYGEPGSYGSPYGGTPRRDPYGDPVREPDRSYAEPSYGRPSYPEPTYADPGHAATTSMAVPSGPSDGFGVPVPREAASNDVNEMVAIIRSSFEAVAPRADELTQLFYGWLFRIAPETRELFPVTMELQRTRLLRALVHVVQMVDRPDDLTIFLRQLGRDHRKFGVLGEHYDKVGESLLGALGEIAGDLWTAEVEEAWTGAYGIVAASMREAADAERGPAVWMARVMEHRRLSQDLAIVRVQTSQPVPYLAGQYVTVETPQRPRMWRSMSPANAPGPDCVMEFHVRTVPGGWVSRAIVSHAKVGDVWRIGPPMGQMTLDPRSRSDLLMVAGGTGLAPSRSIIEQLVHEGTDRKVCLFVGGRTWEDLYDVESLRRMAQENPWLTVVPVVEDDGRRHGAETGTVGEVVARYGAWADRETMVAGSPAMVRSTVSAMLEAGTPFTRIHYDPYHTD